MLERFRTRGDGVGLLLRWAIPLAAACLTALAAHLLIDVVGDYALAHDAYDDLQHGSRWLASGAVLASAFCVVWMLARAVIAETRGRPGAFRTALRFASRTRASVLALEVAALSFPLLLGMAGLDDIFAGVGSDSVSKLLGGSIALGVGLLTATALIVALATRALITFLLRSHTAIVRVVAALVGANVSIVKETAIALARGRRRQRIHAALGRCIRTTRAPPITA